MMIITPATREQKKKIMTNGLLRDMMSSFTSGLSDVKRKDNLYVLKGKEKGKKVNCLCKEMAKRLGQNGQSFTIRNDNADLVLGVHTRSVDNCEPSSHFEGY